VNLESEIHLEVLQHEDKERQFDRQLILWILRAGYEGAVRVRPDDFHDATPDVLVGDPSDVTVLKALVPDASWLRTHPVKHIQQTRLAPIPKLPTAKR
jgi:hypothetical protein